MCSIATGVEERSSNEIMRWQVQRRYLFTRNKSWNSLLQDVRNQFKKQLSIIMEEKSVQRGSTQTPLIQELFEVQIRILRKHFGEQPPLSSCCH